MSYRAYRAYRAITWLSWLAVAPLAAARRASGSAEWAERMGAMPSIRPHGLWVHAASVGEVAAVAPLVRALSDSASSLLVTTVTRTGRAAAARALGDIAGVAYAPLDFVPAVSSALELARPRALLLTETELWPNTIAEAVAREVAVGVINGRMSEKSLRRYTMPGSPVRQSAAALSFAVARSAADAARFRAVGVPPSVVRIAGDLKYDKLGRPLPEPERAAIREELRVPSGTRVVVFGSVRPGEEAYVVEAVTSLARDFADVFVLVAPRHMDRVRPLARRLEAAGQRTVLRSAPSNGREDSARAMVLDTTGELARAYAIAHVAFVGGSLAAYGGHDPLEPAAQGIPVLMGPHTESCSESARRLVEGGGAFRVARGEALGADLARLLSDEHLRADAAAKALEAVEAGRGAVGRTLEFLRELGVLDGR